MSKQNKKLKNNGYNMKVINKIFIILFIIFTLSLIPASFNEFNYISVVEATSVKINANKKTLKVGDTYKLKIKGTTQKVKWSTSNKKIATVSSNGNVTAKKKGTVIITAQIGKSKYKCNITVIAGAKISEKNHAINVGEKFTLKIIGKSGKITWSSSDKKIATVDKNGKVTAKKEGTAIIKATIGKTTYTCTVYVENLKPWWDNAEDCKVYKKGCSVDVFKFDTKQKVKWSSSNTNIVKVDNKGVTTCVDVGTATITAQVGKKKFTYKMTVRDFSKDITVTTKESHESNDSLGVVVAYFKNNSSLSYGFDATVHFYDKNKNEIATKTQYNIKVRAGATIAYPFPFVENEYKDYDSYKIAFPESYFNEDYCMDVFEQSDAANKVTLEVVGHDEDQEHTEDVSKIRGSWWEKIINNSDKTIRNVRYSIIGYNEKGAINFYYVDDTSFLEIEPNTVRFGSGFRYFAGWWDEVKNEEHTLIPSRVESYVLSVYCED